MEKEQDSFKASDDACLNDTSESPSTVTLEAETFLHFDSNSDLSFEDKSTIYFSLVALVKAGYPFDTTLQDKATLFLKNLEPMWGDDDYAPKFVTDLVPSTDGSAAGFVESNVTLLSSPHSTVVVAVLSFLYKTTLSSVASIRCNFVESDLISNVLTNIQPHPLTISGNEEIISSLITIIDKFVNLASQPSLSELGITTVDKYNRREMIFHKVVIPSSQFVTFLISNRFILNGDLFFSFMSLLRKLPEIGPFHRPTLEFVLASPIVMALSSCLSFIDNDDDLWTTLIYINLSLEEWNEEDPEVVKSGKQIIQTLFSEGFEDTLEQKLLNDKNGLYGFRLVDYCRSVLKFLGSNVPRR
ncbi:hypothetical protein BLNAU_22469 [Blattamonas nauphoetae]|uniref:Uncharacterized protein n=1 Tax=Blattamonas nauphoetae TaxID=2049346 RepID=A0ABQ9WTG5_9EUKA|nr:hypothetical protein BLNAU_22469 [Blattamonas nauphoetae]